MGQRGKSVCSGDEADKTSPVVSLAYGNACLDVDSLVSNRLLLESERIIEFAGSLCGSREAYGRQNIAVLAISNYQKAAELDSTSAIIR